MRIASGSASRLEPLIRGRASNIITRPPETSARRYPKGKLHGKGRRSGAGWVSEPVSFERSLDTPRSPARRLERVPASRCLSDPSEVGVVKSRWQLQSVAERTVQSDVRAEN